MKVLVVDDHALFREGMTFMLRELADSVEVVETATCEQALAMAGDHRDLDLILLDYMMPGTTGAQEVSKFQMAWRSTPIVIISGVANDWDIAQSFRHGVMGFIPKAYTSAQMLSALRKILKGERFLPPEDAKKVTAFLNDQDGSVHITERQREILGLLSQGMTNKTIARQLGLSDNTVRVHLAAIFQTLGVSTRTEAIFAARREGILHD